MVHIYSHVISKYFWKFLIFALTILCGIYLDHLFFFERYILILLIAHKYFRRFQSMFAYCEHMNSIMLKKIHTHLNATEHVKQMCVCQREFFFENHQREHLALPFTTCKNHLGVY